MLFCHSDTHGIASRSRVSIPLVSDCGERPRYSRRMQAWKGWPDRIRTAKKAAGMTWADVAEKVGVEEPTIRHWLNGTRNLNLEDFFSLCAAVKADPQTILFGKDSLPGDVRNALAGILKNS